VKNIRMIFTIFTILFISSFLFSATIEPLINIQIGEEEDSSAIDSIPSEDDENGIVKMGEDFTLLSEDTAASDIVVMGGDLSIEGLANGDAVCIGGNFHISGNLLGDAVIIGGNADVESTAVIKGDLVCIGGSVSREKGAEVKGEIVNISLPVISSILPFVFKYTHPGRGDVVRKPFIHPFGKRFFRLALFFVMVVALIVLILIIIILFRGGVEKVSDAVRSQFWKTVLAGFLGVLLIIPLTVLLAVLIIGIPLVPVLWIAFVAALIFGYVCIAYTIGKIIAEKRDWKDRSPYILALLGLAIIEVIPFLGRLVALPGGLFNAAGGFLNFLGFIIVYIVFMVGLGGVILTRFGARKFGK